MDDDYRTRVERLTTQAVEALGSREKATRWILTRNWTLNRATPLERARTMEGMREVQRLLVRLGAG